MGTLQEDRPRYTPPTTFETFPASPTPDIPAADYANDPSPQAIAAAAVLKKRTLTNLYNARPAWLDHAHRAPDQAVAEAYGWGDDWR
jgi:hypothetical protein